MRPRKKVLLLMENEHELGRWRFIIETRGCYRVLTASCLECAKDLLGENPDCQAALTDIPGELGVDGLSRAFRGQMRFFLLFGARCVPADTCADAVEMLEVPGGICLAERVLANVARFTARKRGPKPKPVELSCELQPTLQTLLDEALHAADREPDVGVRAA